jgi:hypothetical protein
MFYFVIKHRNNRSKVSMFGIFALYVKESTH